MLKLKKLPVGIQTFSEIREENYLYVDKTAAIKQLVEEGKHYFLSRPRRFGKSLLVSTLQALFEGRKELFEGLYISDKWDWETIYPVIKISFGGVARDLESMYRMVGGIMEFNQDNLGIKCKYPESGGVCLKELIRKAYKQYGQKVVVLVDEYDKLIVDNLDQPEVAKQGREVLKDLYSTIKDNDEYIQFTFLTGVSKFSKVSIFSGLNNLEDITLSPTFATICGYTQHDLETTFADHLAGVDMQKVREWYNGYNFLGDKVYNPFDILLFIKNGFIFKSYWFATGTPTFLLKLIEQNNYFIPKLNNLCVSEMLIDSYDIENIDLEPILFQSGYLTIARVEEMMRGGIQYVLRFPNKEVVLSFMDVLIEHFTSHADQRGRFQDELYLFLKNRNMHGLELSLKALFGAIPYTNYTRNQISKFEGYYASVIYAYLASLGLDIRAEDTTSTGRIDLSICMGNTVFILEFKVDGKQDALEQIKDKRYHTKYASQGREIYLIGIDFDSTERNICRFEWEKIRV
jgi:hypothetical protein